MYLQTVKRELQFIKKNFGMMLILIVGPIFLTLLFGGVYSHEYVKDIKIAVLDEDNSSISELVINNFATNERFIIDYYPQSRQELQELIDNGKAAMGVYIPPEFEKNVTTFNSSQILLITDGSNLVVANNAYAQAVSIIQTISAGIEIKLLGGKGLIPQNATNMALAFNLQDRVLYDTKMTYMNYLLVCFIAVFIQQMLMAAYGRIIIEDKQFIKEGKLYVKALGIMTACLMVMLPALFTVLIIIKYLFKIKLVGNLMIVFLMTIIFAFTLLGPAFALADYTKKRVRFSQISFMLSLPTFVASGAVWPVEQMPKGVQVLSKLLWPLINYAKPMQEIIVKGREGYTVIPEIIFMLIWGTLLLVAATIMLEKRKNAKLT